MDWQSEQDSQRDSQNGQDARSGTNDTTTGTGSNHNSSETATPSPQSVPEPTRRPQPSGDHWCHECQREIAPLMVPHPMCPQCHSEFVEKIEADNDPRAFAQTAARDDEAGHQGGQDPQEEFIQLLNMFLGGAQRMYQPPAPQQQQQQQQQRQGQTPSSTTQFFYSLGPFGTTTTTTISGGSGVNGTSQNPFSFGGGFSSSFSSSTSSSSPQTTLRGERDATTGSMGGPEAGGQRPTQSSQGLPWQTGPNSISELFQRLGLGGGGFLGPLLGNSFLQMAGNPGNYVWSQEELDDVITHFMELQNRQNGPVAATEEIIDRIPHHRFTAEELAAKPECSVCKDEFTQEDDALQLPCKHSFHEDCIKPWLKVSGTCPTCRFSLVDGDEGTEQSGENSSTSTSTGAETNTSNAQSAQSQSSRGIGGMRPGFLSMSIPGAFPTNAGNGAGNNSSNTTSSTRTTSSNNNRGGSGNNADTDMPSIDPVD